MGYKVIMIDSSPGHLEKEEVTQRSQKSGVEKCWETGGSDGWAAHSGSWTPTCFLLPFAFPHVDQSLRGVQPRSGFKPPISSQQRVLSLGFSGLEIHSGWSF